MKTGKVELQAATQAIHVAKGLIKKMRKPDSAGANGEISAAINPTIVIGATTGAASTLATMLMGLT